MTLLLGLGAIVLGVLDVWVTFRLIDGRWSRDWLALVVIVVLLLLCSVSGGLALDRLDGGPA